MALHLVVGTGSIAAEAARLLVGEGHTVRLVQPPGAGPLARSRAAHDHTTVASPVTRDDLPADPPAEPRGAWPRPVSRYDPPAEPPPGPIWVTGTGEPFDARETIGHDPDEAEAIARRRGCRIRVLILEGERLNRTDDFKPHRINVAVSDGVVATILGMY